jgi:cytochrome c oxidase assembly protein subunit 15
MEWLHRFLGRMIGLAFLVPFLWFLLRRRFDASLALKLAGIFVLGGLQGLMGWYMVKSGLVDDPRVSQYRLVAHLALALLIYGLMLWTVLDLLAPRVAVPAAETSVRKLQRFSVWLLLLVFVTLLSGGFVAGVRAGFAYNTFPLMNGHVVPPEIFTLDPWWMNFFSNMATVQFDHRLLASLLALLVFWFWLRARRVQMPGRARLASHALLGALVLQFALGVATLLLVMPIPLAAAHQANAVALFSCAIWLVHEMRSAVDQRKHSPERTG